jgi:DNA end-binding protein Ku
MLKLAEHIVESKEGDFQPDLFVDHYETALVEIIRKKQAHVPVRKGTDKVAAPKNVINLMDALRRSVENGTRKLADTPKATKAQAAKKGKKRVEGQREMLLPISGKKEKQAKSDAKPAARRKAG